MGFLLRIVGSKLWGAVVSTLAAMATTLLAFWSGKRSQQKKQELEDLKDYKKAREQLDAVDTDLDRDARIERLRSNNNVRED